MFVFPLLRSQPTKKKERENAKLVFYMCQINIIVKSTRFSTCSIGYERNKSQMANFFFRIVQIFMHELNGLTLLMISMTRCWKCKHWVIQSFFYYRYSVTLVFSMFFLSGASVFFVARNSFSFDKKFKINTANKWQILVSFPGKIGGTSKKPNRFFSCFFFIHFANRNFARI